MALHAGTLRRMSNKKSSGKRRNLLSTLLLTLLVLALATSLFANQTIANPIQMPAGSGPPPAPIVEVIELDTDTLTLTFQVQAIQASYIEVFVDGKIWSRLGWVEKPISVSLEGLSNGWHTLKVTATADNGGLNEMQLGGGARFISQGSSDLIEFLVSVPPPSIQVQSLENTALDEGDFQFALRVDGRTPSWVGYSLDGEENVTVYQVSVQRSLTSNDEVWKDILTLTGLYSGVHGLVVYAKDQTGNTGASATKEFTVEVTSAKETQAAPLSTALTSAAIIASVAVISFGLAAYFVKRRRKRPT
jgi:multisubunit Na+/H+ antiporter MnhC subunit